MRTIGKVLVLAMAVSGIAALGVAQNQSLQFDVASIKPSLIKPPPVIANSGVQLFFTLEITGGRLIARNTTLKALVQFAYGDSSASRMSALFTVVGGPAFIGEDRYVIEAKSEGVMSSETARIMMRSLLQDRFALSVHKETRELPVYQLLIAKSGLKLKPVAEDVPRGLRRTTTANGAAASAFTAPISVFVDELQSRADRFVIDKTELSGLFESLITDDARPPDIGVTNGTASLPSSDLPFRLDRYGLRLESAKAMVEVIVIDHAEKPDAN